MSRRVGVMLAILAAAAGAALVFSDRLATVSPWQWAGVAFALTALMLVAGGNRLGPHAARNALIWICIVLGIALAYRFLGPALPQNFGLN